MSFVIIADNNVFRNVNDFVSHAKVSHFNNVEIFFSGNSSSIEFSPHELSAISVSSILDGIETVNTLIEMKEKESRIVSELTHL